jgi:cytochrome P450
MVDTATADLPAFPMPRPSGCPIGAPPQYRTLQQHCPVSKVRHPDGSWSWLITDYALAKQLLTHPHVSSDRAKPGFPALVPGTTAQQRKGVFIGMDPPEHSQHRRMVINEFTVRRIADMRPAIQRITDTMIDDMLAGPRPADLVAALALPVPSLVICELLGVPYSDRDMFQALSRDVLDRTVTPEHRYGVLVELRDYLNMLVVAKEATHSEDLLGRLIEKYRERGEYDREVIIGAGMLMLVAGHETTANMTALSVLSLLTDQELRDTIMADPQRTPALVEELLRFHSITDTATSRTAIGDITIGDATIRAGEGIIISGAAANHDPTVFSDPDQIDLDRGGRHHLGFGYGIHQCLGQNLARVELEIVLNTLLAKVPDLRLAVPVKELEFKSKAVIYGLEQLPVTWSDAV